MKLEPQLPGALDGHVIKGRFIAEWLRGRVAVEVERLKGAGHGVCLAVVRVGDDAASELYVNGKVKACEKAGITSRHVHLPAATAEDEVIAAVRALNGDPEVDAVLVQLPLPAHINSRRVMEVLSPGKDADGFHPDNLGRLFQRYGLLEPCTPLGVMVMLRAIGAQVAGSHAVVLGRSVIVGRPVADMLLRANATVTICHRHTHNTPEHCRRADIIVAATGVGEMVRGDWVKEGAVVIDVGQFKHADGRLTGDVAFDEVALRASAITPVPGGVGPMTIAMLLWNTVLAATARRVGTDAAFELHHSLISFS